MKAFSQYDEAAGRETHTRTRPGNAGDAANLLAVAAQLVANGVTPDILRQSRQEMRLVAQGAAGQEAGPHGMGPDPVLQHAPGGELLEHLQHPAFTTVEYLYRVLPNDSWFDATRSPNNPLSFELGAVTVNSQQIFVITDYEFVCLRQSGVDPFDWVAAAPYRFSGFMAFRIAVASREPGQVSYQLDPAPQQARAQSFEPPIGGAFAPAPSQAVFNKASANAFGAVAGFGKSLLPVRSNVMGPRDQPFSAYGQQGDSVSLSCTIFRRITAPLAAIQGSVSGYTIHQNTLATLLQRVRPV